MASLINTSVRSINRLQAICISSIPRRMTSEWGSGSGKGGGAGGAIREAGGSFGKLEAAREEEYFRKKQKDQLEKMRKGLIGEQDRLDELIKQHEEEIKRLQKLQKEAHKDDK